MLETSPESQQADRSTPPAPAQRRPRRSLRTLGRDSLGYIAIVTLCTVMVMPFLWMALSSFKPRAELFRYPPTFFPESWTLHHYKNLFVYSRIASGMTGEEIQQEFGLKADVGIAAKALKDSSIARVYFNATRIFAFAALGTVIVGGLAGYAFAKIEFPGRDMLFLFLLSSMMIPWMTILLPRYVMFRTLGWVGTPLPLFMPELLFGTSFAIFFFRQHFRTIPNALIEAALIDGATHWKIFWNLMLPLSKTVVLSLIVFTLLSKWNSLLGPLIYLTHPREFTPPQVLYHLAMAYGNERDPGATGLIMAGSLLTVAPVLITFFLAQRYFISGLTSGAVKE
ncbi:MAG: carbohydrate ABC transporter permease [Chloroflexota bacterium]